MMVMRARDRADMYKDSDPNARKAVFTRCPKGVFLGIFCFIIAIVVYRFLIYRAPQESLPALSGDNLS